LGALFKFSANAGNAFFWLLTAIVALDAVCLLPKRIHRSAMVALIGIIGSVMLWLCVPSA